MSKNFYLNKNQIKKIVDDVLVFVYKYKYEINYAIKLAIKNELGELNRDDWSYCFKKISTESKEKIVEIKLKDDFKKIEKLIQERDRIRELLGSANFSENDDLENLKTEELRLSREINRLHREMHQFSKPEIKDFKERKYSSSKISHKPSKKLNNNKDVELKSKVKKELKEGQTIIPFKFK